MMTGEDQSAVIAALDRLIEGVAPEVSRLAKYGGTLYTLWPEEKGRPVLRGVSLQGVCAAFVE